MISDTYRMDSQSGCIRARLKEIEENVEVSPSVSAKWQAMLAALEARMLRAEEEISRYKGQVPSTIPAVEVQPVQAPVTAIPMGNANEETWYEKFKSHYPRTFEGGTNQLRAERWIALITSILDYMEIEGHERMTCAIQLLKDGSRIWWGVVAQLKDVETMSWAEFQKIFSERYSGGGV